MPTKLLGENNIITPDLTMERTMTTQDCGHNNADPDAETGCYTCDGELINMSEHQPEVYDAFARALSQRTL